MQKFPVTSRWTREILLWICNEFAKKYGKYAQFAGVYGELAGKFEKQRFSARTFSRIYRILTSSSPQELAVIMRWIHKKYGLSKYAKNRCISQFHRKLSARSREILAKTSIFREFSRIHRIHKSPCKNLHVNPVNSRNIAIKSGLGRPGVYTLQRSKKRILGSNSENWELSFLIGLCILVGNVFFSIWVDYIFPKKLIIHGILAFLYTTLNHKKRQNTVLATIWIFLVEGSICDSVFFAKVWSSMQMQTFGAKMFFSNCVKFFFDDYTTIRYYTIL